MFPVLAAVRSARHEPLGSCPTQADNSTNAALDLLWDPRRAEALQLAVVQRAEDAAANAAAAQQLHAMGYRRETGLGPRV